MTPVPDFEHYLVDVNTGKIFNTLKNRYLKPTKTKTKYNPNSYLTCTLYKNGIRKNTTVHQIVYASYIKTWNFNNLEIDHIDGNRQNNNIKNLRLVTRKEQMTLEVCKKISQRMKSGNIDYSKQIEIFKRFSKGEDNNKAKLKKEDVIMIRKMYAQGMLNREIQKVYARVHLSTIQNIKAARTWKHVN